MLLLLLLPPLPPLFSGSFSPYYVVPTALEVPIVPRKMRQQATKANFPVAE